MIDYDDDKEIRIIEDLTNGVERFQVPVFLHKKHEPWLDVSIFERFVYTPRVIDYNGYQNLSLGWNKSCECSKQCSAACNCSANVYSASGGLKSVDEACGSTIRECTASCSCSLWCGNRVAQKGSRFPVEIFSRDAECGWAVRAACRIPQGFFIGEYTGELIDEAEATRRGDSTFLFETKLAQDTLTIDATYCGNYTRFINHSCEPNVKVVNVTWHEKQLVHMCFFASRIIAAGEELTIDYGDAWWTNKSFACLCASIECRYRLK